MARYLLLDGHHQDNSGTYYKGDVVESSVDLVASCGAGKFRLVTDDAVKTIDAAGNVVIPPTDTTATTPVPTGSSTAATPAPKPTSPTPAPSSPTPAPTK